MRRVQTLARRQVESTKATREDRDQPSAAGLGRPTSPLPLQGLTLRPSTIPPLAVLRQPRERRRKNECPRIGRHWTFLRLWNG
eukprot:scaffold294_cov281-Pinguiococcus_pyrenoidosus.AAC.10